MTDTPRAATFPAGQAGSPQGAGWPWAIAVTAMLWLVHAPLLGNPPGWLDAELWSGTLRFEGWLPATWLARAEFLVEGTSLELHRALALVLQSAILLSAPWIARRAGVPGLWLLAPAALWCLHPAHAEVSWRLALRTVLYSECLLWIAVCAWFLRGSTPAMRMTSTVCALITGGAAATGIPAVAALAVPLLWYGGGRGRLVAVGPLVGAGVQLWLSLEGGDFGARLLPDGAALWRTALWPLDIGVFASPAAAWWWGVAAALAAAFVALGRRRALVITSATALAAAIASVLIGPVRADREQLGAGTTPESALLPMALLAAVAFLTLRGRLAPLALIGTAVALVLAGFPRQRAFDDEDAYFARACEQRSDSAPLQRLRAESLLRTIETYSNPVDRDDRAVAAYQCVQVARRLGESSVELDRLEITALAYMGRTQKARDKWEALAQGEEGNASLRILRADIELLGRQPLEALRWIRPARGEGGPLAEARYARIVVACYERIHAALADGSAAETRRLCALLLDIAPAEREAAELSAHTYVMEERWEEAIEAFEEVRRKYPQSLVALSALVKLHERDGDEERANELRAELLRKGGRDAFR